MYTKALNNSLNEAKAEADTVTSNNYSYQVKKKKKGVLVICINGKDKSPVWIKAHFLRVEYCLLARKCLLLKVMRREK